MSCSLDPSAVTLTAHARSASVAVLRSPAPDDSHELRQRADHVGMVAAAGHGEVRAPKDKNVNEVPQRARRPNGTTAIVGTTRVERWTYDRGYGQFPARADVRGRQAEVDRAADAALTCAVRRRVARAARMARRAACRLARILPPTWITGSDGPIGGAARTLYPSEPPRCLATLAHGEGERVTFRRDSPRLAPPRLRLRDADVLAAVLLAHAARHSDDLRHRARDHCAEPDRHAPSAVAAGLDRRQDRGAIRPASRGRLRDAVMRRLERYCKPRLPIVTDPSARC